MEEQKNNATQISLDLFEKNAKQFNKKDMLRSYTYIAMHLPEYVKGFPLGTTDKVVVECTIDKDYVEEFIKLVKKEGYEVLGKNNTYHLAKLIGDYHVVEKQMSQASKDAYAAMEKDLNNLIKENETEKYALIENDDAKFYFLPYKEEVLNVCTFVEKTRRKFSNFAKKNDVTIMLKVKGYSSALEGFICYNFVDAESKDQETIDYFTNFNVSVDCSNVTSVCVAAIALNSLTNEREDLDILNTHIFAINNYYKN